MYFKTPLAVVVLAVAVMTVFFHFTFLEDRIVIPEYTPPYTDTVKTELPPELPKITASSTQETPDTMTLPVKGKEVPKTTLPPPGAILCNGAFWMPCDQDQTFYCPKTGDAECRVKTVRSIEPRAITAKSIVGLLCYYKSKDPAVTDQYADEEGRVLAKASGVVVSPDGYILTVKHLIDPEWANWAYEDTMPEWRKTLNANIEFEYCEVGVPQSDTLPTREEIVSINPSLLLQHPFPYRATLFFKPSQKEMSELEYRELDFAVLKIAGPREDCATFNLCDLPRSFDYNPALSGEIPKERDEVISFGYPAEPINSEGGAFSNFLLKGAVGPLLEHYAGDKYFEDLSFVFRWSANGVIPGRSGSPVFWKGHVTGILYAGSAENTTIDFAISLPAINRVLQAHNLAGILAHEQ